MRNKDKNKQKRRRIVWVCVLIFIISVLGYLQLGCVYTEKNWSYFYPEYEKKDLSAVLAKSELSDEDYELVYRQTGLTKLGVDGLLEVGDIAQILKIQDFFFTKQEVIIDRFNPYTYDETILQRAPMARLEDGDILVTATTRVSWWRYGHAALVVDGDARQLVESVSPGTKSQITSARDFEDLADFLVLRPKVDKEKKAEIVQFAKENLVGIPYRFTVGILYKKFDPNQIKVSQCAHLVWYAYKKFGIDLDSNGRGIVKPQDMALSEHVEVVQAYGFDLDTLWS